MNDASYSIDRALKAKADAVLTKAGFVKQHYERVNPMSRVETLVDGYIVGFDIVGVAVVFWSGRNRDATNERIVATLKEAGIACHVEPSGSRIMLDWGKP